MAFYFFPTKNSHKSQEFRIYVIFLGGGLSLVKEEGLFKNKSQALFRYMSCQKIIKAGTENEFTSVSLD